MFYNTNATIILAKALATSSGKPTDLSPLATTNIDTSVISSNLSAMALDLERIILAFALLKGFMICSSNHPPLLKATEIDLSLTP